MKAKFIKGMGTGLALSIMLMNSEKSFNEAIKDAGKFVKKTIRKISELK